MIAIANILIVVAAAPLIVFSLYLFVITLASYFPRVFRVPGAQLSIAVIIPAHNEASCIFATIETLLRSTYPKDLFTVWVIADNCDDDTAELARRTGVRVAERTDVSNRGKGQALDWFVRSHVTELGAYEALTFVDADTTVDVGFLGAMAESLAHPKVQAVQGCNRVSNASAHWRAAITSAGFGGVNIVRPLGQTRLGGSVQLKGNGMAFATDVVLARGWPAHGIVEDMEYGLQLLLDGIRVHFNPRALVESGMPTDQIDASSQRRRWEGGRFAVALAYAPKLMRRFLATGKYVYLDALLEAMMPPLSILVLWTFGVLLAAAAAGNWGLVIAVCACVLSQTTYLVSSLIQIRAPLRVWLMLPAIPLFIACKIPVYISLAVRRQTAWNRTPRAGE